MGRGSGTDVAEGILYGRLQPRHYSQQEKFSRTVDLSLLREGWFEDWSGCSGTRRWAVLEPSLQLLEISLEPIVKKKFRDIRDYDHIEFACQVPYRLTQLLQTEKGQQLVDDSQPYSMQSVSAPDDDSAADVQISFAKLQSSSAEIQFQPEADAASVTAIERIAGRGGQWRYNSEHNLMLYVRGERLQGIIRERKDTLPAFAQNTRGYPIYRGASITVNDPEQPEYHGKNAKITDVVSSRYRGDTEDSFKVKIQTSKRRNKNKIISTRQIIPFGSGLLAGQRVFTHDGRGIFTNISERNEQQLFYNVILESSVPADVYTRLQEGDIRDEDQSAVRQYDLGSISPVREQSNDA